MAASRNGAFTFRTDTYHDQLLDALSAHLQRTKSDTIRFILCEKGENVGITVLARTEHTYAYQKTVESSESLEAAHG